VISTPINPVAGLPTAGTHKLTGSNILVSLISPFSAVSNRYRLRTDPSAAAAADIAVSEDSAQGVSASAVKSVVVSKTASESGIASNEAAASTNFAPAVKLKAKISNILRLGAFKKPGAAAKLSDSSAKAHGSTLFDAMRSAGDSASFNFVEDEAGTAEVEPSAEAKPKRIPLRKRLVRFLTKPIRFTPAPETEAKPKRTSLVRRFVRFLTKPRFLPAPKTRFSNDEFGGPQGLEYRKVEGTGLWNGLKRRYFVMQGQARYGLKWAINMLGLSAILSVVLKPILALVPWQIFVSDGFLFSTGRIELLTDVGPQGIAAALAESPLDFLLIGMPGMVIWEEISFRLLGFGLTWLWLVGMKRAAEWMLKKVEGALKSGSIPDVMGQLSMLRAGLRVVRWIGSQAFLIAATTSAFAFSAAHIAAWGFNPLTLAIHFALGMVLARVGYRSRSLIAPAFAHFFYNLGMIGLGFALPMLLLPATSQLVGTLLSLAAVAFLWYQDRAHRKDRASAVADARGVPVRSPGLFKRIVVWLMALATLGGAGLASLTGGSSLIHKTVQNTATNNVTLIDMEEAMLPPGHPVVPAAEAPAGTVLTTKQITRQNKPAIVRIMRDGGVGSGIIIQQSGLILTNAHNVAKTLSNNGTGADISRDYHDEVQVRLNNGQSLLGIVVAYNSDKDIALIQLPSSPFMFSFYPTAKIGDSNALVEGDQVVAMGYPLGLPFSVSEGIVSGLDRRQPGRLVTHIQHDAAVNPGNSGGGLFNDRGELVGINSSIATQGGGFDGISFAITSADAKAVLEQFMKIGNIDTAWMGAIFHPAAHDGPGYGAAVEMVRPDSPAWKAGLRPGDVILQADGHKLENDPDAAVGHLAAHVREKIPTQELSLKVERDGKVIELTVQLGIH
ncbi:MAG: trypsin-like peptidase domain-containing protein, partial [Elusimicrobiota bacterium]